jgi:hypothetical protein
MFYTKYKTNKSWWFGVLAGGWVFHMAAQAQDPGKHALDYTYAEGSPQYWRGMHSTRPGNFVFRKDPHIWVVSPELGKKAGLPLEWTSEELQGVSAAAWRMQPGEEQCGWGGQPQRLQARHGVHAGFVL